MNFTLEDLNNLSALARISIKEDEKGKMFESIKAILGYVSEINNASSDVVKEKETPHFAKASRGTHYNIVRDDVVTNEQGGNTKAILDNAPDTEDG